MVSRHAGRGEAAQILLSDPEAPAPLTPCSRAAVSTFLLFDTWAYGESCSCPGAHTPGGSNVRPTGNRKQLRGLLVNDDALEHFGDRTKFSRTMVSFPGSASWG